MIEGQNKGTKKEEEKLEEEKLELLCQKWAKLSKLERKHIIDEIQPGMLKSWDDTDRSIEKNFIETPLLNMYEELSQDEIDKLIKILK